MMPGEGAGYQLLEHTADAGLEAWGHTPAEAFEQAAFGMFEIALGEHPQKWRGAGERAEVRVETSGDDWPDLLVNWLAEMVYLFDTEGFVPRGFRFEECAPPRCSALAGGTLMSDPAEAAGVGIKAVTYHGLAVQVSAGETRVKVIFDI
jgi:SHS2 domain-containing protein